MRFSAERFPAAFPCFGFWSTGGFSVVAHDIFFAIGTIRGLRDDKAAGQAFTD